MFIKRRDAVKLLFSATIVLLDILRLIFRLYRLGKGVQALGDVLIHTAGDGCPTEVKKLLSSGNVLESDTTAKACICK